MQRIRKGKRQKRYSSSSCSSHNNSHLVDRLPEDVLVHILSLLSTRDCVKSSILGKRWRLLWARVPNLKLDSGDHKTLSSFSNFLNRFVFVHKGQNINTFRIAYDVKKNSDYKLEIETLFATAIGYYKLEIETLIATAIGCNVQVVDIHSRFELLLPPCLFTCKTLVDLTLNRVCVGTTSVVYLPALKKLKLKRMVRYESEESLEHLISGCPALEELTIFRETDDVVCLRISSPTLTRLHFLFDCDFGFNEYNEVKLDTPALEYLWLDDDVSRDFSAGVLGSLTEADVDFGAQTSVLEFVGKLNNASCLKLRTSWNWVEAPDSAFSALTTTTEFRNLTKLELVGYWRGDWRFVTYFLENSDNLQVLIIRMFSDHQMWKEPKRVPVCLLHHLGIVRFQDFQCSKAEFNVVEYILRNAKVLKRMEILFFSNSRGDLKKRSEARQRISLFERASEACELAFD